MKCERWIDQHYTSVGQRKNSESLARIKPMTSWTPVFSKSWVWFLSGLRFFCPTLLLNSPFRRIIIANVSDLQKRESDKVQQVTKKNIQICSTRFCASEHFQYLESFFIIFGCSHMLFILHNIKRLHSIEQVHSRLIFIVSLSAIWFIYFSLFAGDFVYLRCIKLLFLTFELHTVIDRHKAHGDPSCFQESTRVCCL